MSSIESFDGLCGLHAPFASSGLRLRCKYPMVHHGPCSWEKYRSQFHICGGTFYDPNERVSVDGFKQGFINAVVYHNYKFSPIVITSHGKLKIKL